MPGDSLRSSWLQVPVTTGRFDGDLLLTSLYRSPVLPANQIHFVFQFENAKAWAAGFEKWNTNPGVVEILIESRQYLDATTCKDKFYRDLP